MKKIIACIITLTFIISVTAIPAFAANDEWSYSDRANYLIEDTADMLTDQEDGALEEKLNEISLKNKCEVAIVTLTSLDVIGENPGSIQDVADDIYDYFEYGFGDNDDGLLLLVTPTERAITTYGFAQTAFTDDGLAYMVGELKPLFEKGHNNEALNKFADETDRFLQKARNGKPYTKWTLKPLGVRVGLTALLAIAIGLLLSSIIMISMKNSMKSVRFQGQADFYLKEGSLVINNSKDNFIGTDVSRVKKVKSESRDGGGGGSHTSSSGRTHGGTSF
jgi:hypothetical protein